MVKTPEAADHPVHPHALHTEKTSEPELHWNRTVRRRPADVPY